MAPWCVRALPSAMLRDPPPDPVPRWQHVNQTAVPNLAAWRALGYNYFTMLNSSQVASSCQMRGPCYPVLTTQKATLNTCLMQVRAFVLRSCRLA